MTDRGPARRRLLMPLLGAAAGVTMAGLRRRRSNRPGSPYLSGAPLLIAHRGGSALAPENTLLAFERAIDWWGSDIIELDVHPTRDGQVVVFHDPTLDRTTNGSGPLALRSLAELKSFDAGYTYTADGGETHPFRGTGVQIPTLAEVLDRFPGIRVNIEIKDGRVQDQLWQVIRDTDSTGRVLIAAGSSKDRARLDGYPVPVSAGEEELRPFVAQLKLGLHLYTPDVDALQVPDVWDGRNILSPALIQAAHAQNIAVHVWTVDEVDLMHRYLEWGVDGIVTDRPDRLARVLHERTGRPLPPGPPAPLPEPSLERMLLDARHPPNSQPPT